MNDDKKRKINYLRLSITDSCNLHCIYCMPKAKCSFIPNEELLTVNEIGKIAEVVAKLGIKKIRITGGEPLIRKDFLEILKRINSVEGIEKIAITTNGLNLLENLELYKENGLKCINISIDSLDKEKYKKITRGGNLEEILKTLDKAVTLEYEHVRINVVVLKDINDNEIFDFVELTKKMKIGVRFIEIMPIGEGKKFEILKNSEILKLISEKYQLENKGIDEKSGPANYYKVEGYEGEIGFISPISNQFCDKCNRIRVTSKGFLKLCLHYNIGIDLKPFLNGEIEDLKEVISEAIKKKPEKHEMDCLDFKKDIETKMMNEIGG